jgi:hypothetical protein
MVMLESDLFPPIKQYLINKGYKVGSEIEHCDIVATKDDFIIIIELKRSLSVELLVQAVKRQKLTEYVYIAVPKKNIAYRKWNDILHLIKRLELGLIIVDNNDKVEVILEPLPLDRKKSMQSNKGKRKKLLTEFEGRTIDNNIGGSTGKKIMTAYKDKSLYIASCLDLHGPLSPKQLKLLGTDVKKTPTILTKNFNGWFYRVKIGVYDLSDQGKKALEEYNDIVIIHKQNIIQNNK